MVGSGLNADSEEKTRILKEIAHLQHKIKALERERNVSFAPLKAHSDVRQVFTELDSEFVKFEDERKSDQLKMRRNVEKLRANVRAFRAAVIEMKNANKQLSPGNGGSLLEKLREKVEEIDTGINNFKSKQREGFEFLLLTEKTLSQELAAFERRMEVWDSTSTTGVAPTPSKVRLYNISNDDASKPTAVIEFDKFLDSSGGERGGWEEYDHVTFIKFYNQFSTSSAPNQPKTIKSGARSKLIDRLAVELPHVSVEKIMEHIDFYSEYLERLEKRKEAIAEWRKQKERERENQQKDAKKEVLQIEGHSTARSNQTEPSEEELKRIEEEKERVRAWREQKEKEAREEKERKEKEEQEKKEREKAYLARQREIKEEIDNMKRAKAQEQELEEMKRLAQQLEEDQIRKAQLAELRKQSTKKALAEAEEKAERKKLQELVEAEKAKAAERRKQAVERQITRDPSRLLKPTQAAISRATSEKESTGGPVIKVQHKAVPSWRANIS